MTIASDHTSASASRRALRVVVALGLVASTSFLVPSAYGHNAVVETSPVAGSTISDSPIDIVVVTSDQLLDLTGTGSGFAIVVRDTAGLYYGDGCVAIGDTDMSTTAALGDAGDYTVTFQFVSADGHSLSDSFGFTFDPAPTHVPVTGFEQAPQCGVEPVASTTSDDETTVTDLGGAPDGVVADDVDPGMSSDNQVDSGPVTLAIAAVLVVLSITLMVWMVRRRNGS